METCYKMFRRSTLEKFDLQSNRFGFEPEFTAKIAKQIFGYMKCRFHMMVARTKKEKNYMERWYRCILSYSLL